MPSSSPVTADRRVATAAPVRVLRIAVVSYLLPRPGVKRGGIERVAHDLANGLAARGHRVVVFSHDPAPTGALYHVEMLPWQRFTTTWLGRRLTMGYLGNVLNVLPPFGDADVVLAHGDSLLLPLRGRPVVRVMHGTAREEARTASSIGRRVMQFGVYGLELLTAATSGACVGVSENTRQSNRFVKRVIPNGVDLRLFRPDPRARAPFPMVLFVGALGGRKRGAWLVEQFMTRVRTRLPGAELHMVCEGGEDAPGLVFHRGLGDRDLAALYRRAWIYASPSTYEGFGLPYVEALASRTPVVATANPGSLEVLAGGTYGRVVPDEAFAAAMLDLLTDEEARLQLGALGLERAGEYSLERMLDRYEDLLASLVRARD